MFSLESLNEFMTDKNPQENENESSALSQIHLKSSKKILDEFFNSFISTPVSSTRFIFTFRDVMRLLSQWLESNPSKSSRGARSASDDATKYSGIVELFCNQAFEEKLRKLLQHSIRTSSEDILTAVTEIVAHVMSVSPSSTWAMCETILDILSSEILKVRCNVFIPLIPCQL